MNSKQFLYNTFFTSILLFSGVKGFSKEKIIETETDSVNETVLIHEQHFISTQTINIYEDSPPIKISLLKDSVNGFLDSDVLKIKSLTYNGIGTIEEKNNTLYYTPHKDFYGTDSISYIVSNKNENEVTGKIRINIKNINDAPHALNDTIYVPVNSIDNKIDVLVNDNDVDIDDNIFVHGITNSKNKAKITHQEYYLLYTPPKDFTGMDSFTYFISDNSYITSFASVKIIVYSEDTSIVADSDNTINKIE